MTTLRWSTWCEKPIMLEMLAKSIKSFQKFCGKDFKYVVCSEKIDSVYHHLKTSGVQFDQILPNTTGLFHVPAEHHTMWIKKFSPELRLFIDETEIFVDLDVFCIREPKHLMAFIEGDSKGVIQARDGCPTKIGYGMWANLVDNKIPACCDGFVGFKPNYDITEKLLQNWFKMLHTHGHEIWTQGAVAKSLEADILKNEITLLMPPGIRYLNPSSYSFDVDKEYCEIAHCINSGATEYKCFNMLIEKGLI